jgi:hypothetical protein
MEQPIKFSRKSFLKRFVISQFILAGFVMCIVLSASTSASKQKAKTETDNASTKAIAIKNSLVNTGK